MYVPARRSWIVVAAVAALACAPDGTRPNSVLPPNSMTAKINNIEFSVLSTVYVTHQRGVLSIGAFDDTQRAVHLVALAPTKPSTVQIGPEAGGNAGITAYRTQVWRTNVSGGAGTITFTHVSATEARGTFSFTAVPSVANVQISSATGRMTVTGSFYVSYVQEFAPSKSP